MNLNTETSDLKMSHYFMLAIFAFFNWVQFVARAIFTVILLLCLEGIGINKLF